MSTNREQWPWTATVRSRAGPPHPQPRGREHGKSQEEQSSPPRVAPCPRPLRPAPRTRLLAVRNSTEAKPQDTRGLGRVRSGQSRRQGGFHDVEGAYGIQIIGERIADRRSHTAARAG